MCINHTKIIEIIACLSIDKIISEIKFLDFSYKNLLEELRNFKHFVEKIIFDDLTKNLRFFVKIESIYMFNAYKSPS